MTTVVNMRREPFDVYIGRVRAQPDGDALSGRGVAPIGKRGWLGNPLAINLQSLREMSSNDARIYLDSIMAGYRVYFAERIEKDPAFRAAVLALRGKRLGCFCKPGPCHGDVIAAWIDAQEVARG